MISGIGTGDEMVALVGDRLHRVRGTEVESERVQGDANGLTGAW